MVLHLSSAEKQDTNIISKKFIQLGIAIEKDSIASKYGLFNFPNITLFS